MLVEICVRSFFCLAISIVSINLNAALSTQDSGLRTLKAYRELLNNLSNDRFDFVTDSSVESLPDLLRCTGKSHQLCTVCSIIKHFHQLEADHS